MLRLLVSDLALAACIADVINIIRIYSESSCLSHMFPQRSSDFLRRTTLFFLRFGCTTSSNGLLSSELVDLTSHGCSLCWSVPSVGWSSAESLAWSVPSVGVTSPCCWAGPPELLAPPVSGASCQAAWPSELAPPGVSCGSCSVSACQVSACQVSCCQLSHESHVCGSHVCCVAMALGFGGGGGRAGGGGLALVTVATTFSMLVAKCCTSSRVWR